jgi:hypothetical protein
MRKAGGKRTGQKQAEHEAIPLLQKSGPPAMNGRFIAGRSP